MAQLSYNRSTLLEPSVKATLSDQSFYMDIVGTNCKEYTLPFTPEMLGHDVGVISMNRQKPILW